VVTKEYSAESEFSYFAAGKKKYKPVALDELLESAQEVAAPTRVAQPYFLNLHTRMILLISLR